MKARWRQHEIIFGTIVALVAIANTWWRWNQVTPAEIRSRYAAPFIQSGAPFSYATNVVLPAMINILVLFLGFLVINLLVIPNLQLWLNNRPGRSLPPTASQKNEKATGWRHPLSITLIFILLIILQGVAFDAAAYYEYQWHFDYPGFTFFPPFGYHPLPQLDVTAGFKLSIMLLFPYCIYAGIRELIIYRMERPGGKQAYRALILNQVTAFLVFYFSAVFFLVVFVPRAFMGPVSTISLALPVFTVVMTNMYWLFPLNKKYPFLSTPFLWRLLLSTLIITFLFVFVLRPMAFLETPSFLLCWAIQVFVVTPLSWLVWQQRKDKILQLRGAEEALVKSTASLQMLRSQINPHFLFNVLNTLYGTAMQENAGRTAEGIQKLGDMMRFMLHDNNLDRIRMNREIAYLENYISLQQLRTQSSPGIVIESVIDAAHCDHLVAPMLFIPFVENAFKHGISLKEKSWITIRLHCDEQQIHFEVSNSVHPHQPADPEIGQSGIGLKNVRERLQLFYPGRHTLITRGDEREFFARLIIRP